MCVMMLHLGLAGIGLVVLMLGIGLFKFSAEERIYAAATFAVVVFLVGLYLIIVNLGNAFFPGLRQLRRSGYFP